MSNPFAAIGHYLLNFLKAIGGQLKITVATFLKSFAAEDLGKLAIDAVAYVEASMEGADGAAKRDAAAQKFVADAKAAGQDVENFSKSLVNFFIESALQAFLAGVGANESAS
jgi:hypothetical protein